MLFDQSDKIRRRIPRQRRFGKVRIRRNEILGPAINIREIAAPAARNQNLFAEPLGMFEHRHAPPPLARLDRAHQSRSATAKNQSIKFVDQGFANLLKLDVLSQKYTEVSGAGRVGCETAGPSTALASLRSGRDDNTNSTNFRDRTLDVVEQGHEAKIHVQLLMAVEQREAGIVS